MPVAGEYPVNGGVHVIAVNFPLESQQLGDYLMWDDLDNDNKLMHLGQCNLRATAENADLVTSIVDFLWADAVMVGEVPRRDRRR